MKRKLIIFFLWLILFSAILLQSAAAEQEGTASWYGGKFHGRKTANGEIFDTNKLTAAHRALPFNTMVKVTNLGNNRSVIVRVNDRGPFIQGRIIDLSRAAAERLDMVHTGTARVRVEVLSSASTGTAEPKPVPAADRRFIIQVGSFSVAANARHLHTFLRGRGFLPEFESAPPNITRVVLHNIAEGDIQTVVSKLRASGINDVLIRKLP